MRREDRRRVGSNDELKEVRPRARPHRCVDEGLAPATVRQGYVVLSNALSQAVKWKLITFNPAQDIDLPKASRPDIKPPSTALLEKVVEATKSTPYFMAIVLASTAGLRREEVLALRWANVDLEEGCLRVEEALEQVGTQLSIIEPKSGNSAGDIELLPSTVSLLKLHKKDQAKRRLQADGALLTRTYVLFLYRRRG